MFKIDLQADNYRSETFIYVKTRERINKSKCNILFILLLAFNWKYSCIFKANSNDKSDDDSKYYKLRMTEMWQKNRREKCKYSVMSYL